MKEVLMMLCAPIILVFSLCLSKALHRAKDLHKSGVSVLHNFFIGTTYNVSTLVLHNTMIESLLKCSTVQYCNETEVFKIQHLNCTYSIIVLDNFTKFTLHHIDTDVYLLVSVPLIWEQKKLLKEAINRLTDRALSC